MRKVVWKCYFGRIDVSVENLQNCMANHFFKFNFNTFPSFPTLGARGDSGERATECLIFLLFASRDTPLRRSLISLWPTTTVFGRQATKAGREKTSGIEGNPGHPQQSTIVNGFIAVMLD